MAAFIFSIIILLVSLGAIAYAIFGDFASRNPRVWAVIGSVLGIFLAGGLFYASLFHSVPAKSEGVVTSYGKVIGTPYGPGSHLMAPWRSLSIVQDTIQSDNFSDANGTGPDQQFPYGTKGYCIKVRLAGLNQGCANVQLQTQVVAAAIPELYANYSSYGPNLSQDVDQFVVKRELTTDLNRALGDYNVIQDVAANLTTCIQTTGCSAVTASQFSKFDPAILTALQSDPELSGKISVSGVNLQNIIFNGTTENAIQKIQDAYLQTVEATQQEKTNAAISLANAALIKQNALSPAVLQNECYTTTQDAVKANYTLPAGWNCSGGSSSVLVQGK